MKKYTHILLFTITALLFGACSSNNELPIIDELPDGMIEIRYSQSKFDVQAWNTNGMRSVNTRASQTGSQSEQKIDNIYILMLRTGATPIRYYSGGITGGTEGTWNNIDKVQLKVSQSVAGERDVYVIANVSTTLKGALDGVNDLAGLKNALQANSSPWSPVLGTENNVSILMSGSIVNHNFSTNRTTSSVELIRALAKIELSITLGTKHQDTDATKYKYNFVDFDKNTFVLENTTTAEEDKKTSGWQAWQQARNVTTYSTTGDKVTSLTLVTYINETTNAGSLIDIKLPYNDGGPLPPPEFGPETFQLPLPETIMRNHWYKYDIEI